MNNSVEVGKARDAANAVPDGSASLLLTLENDLASIIRVRERLAKTTDSQLPRVFHGLLPRLLSKLDDNSRALSLEISLEERLIREKIQKELKAAFSDSIMERIRANTDVSALWLEPVASFLSSTLQRPSQDRKDAVTSVAMTFALSLLRFGVARCAANDPAVHLVLEASIRAVDHLHKLKCTITNDASDLHSFNLRAASWVCLDAIAIIMGMKPVVDWELDCYDYKEVWVTSKMPSYIFTIAAQQGAVQAVMEDGSGVFDLFMDVLLLWPDGNALSEEGCCRGQHRSNRFPFNSYLSDLKIACLRYAVWPLRKGLFQGENAGASRAVMLLVLTGSKNSKVGRMAADILKAYVGRHKPRKRQKTDVAAPGMVGCSLSLVCSFLVLVLGDEAASPILERYPMQRALWEDVLGPRRPGIGHPVQRLPLPSGMSASAIDFIIQFDSEYLLECKEEDEIRLFVDLASAAQNQDGFEGQRAIQLIAGVACNHIVKSNLVHDEAWTEAFYQTCLSEATEILSAIFTRENDGGHGLDGDVPAPFVLRFGRADFAQRVVSHRKARKEQRRKSEIALKGRVACYQMIRDLSCHVKILQQEGRLSFEIPVLLFQFAADEDETLQPIVAEALISLLTCYKNAILVKETGSSSERHDPENDAYVLLQHQAAPLLPSLLSTVCCDSAEVRLASVMWIKELLYLIDPLAASLLCCYFAADVDTEVSDAAKTVLRKNEVEKRHREDTSLQKNSTISPREGDITFINMCNEQEFAALSAELDSKIAFVADSARMPFSAAAILLLQFDFSAEKALDRIANDMEAVITFCGLKLRCSGYDTLKSLSGKYCRSEKHECGICYDGDFRHCDMYAMPCAHEFCRGCWRSFIETSLGEGPADILRATCPSSDCNERLTDADIKEIAPDLLPCFKNRYVNSFVDKDKTYCWCPGPNCEMVVKARAGIKKVTCERCETSFCFGCREVPHSPARCQSMRLWSEIFADSKFWIAKNTKPCPQCNSPIEKNQGCNHMTCSQCRCEFCWLCLTPVNSHSEPHTCNAYSPLQNEHEDDVNRKVFFSERFQVHEEAEIFANHANERRYESFGGLLRRHPFLTYEAFDILETSGETLVECRRFLKYSYVTAYTMKDETKQTIEIFEKLQGTLELFTEKLSQLTERDLEKVLAEKGQRGVEMHLRSLSFYAISVTKYTERVLSFLEQLAE